MSLACLFPWDPHSLSAGDPTERCSFSFKFAMKSYKTVTRVSLLWWRMSDTVHLNAVHRLAEDVQISGRFHCCCCCCYCRRRFCCCCCCCCCCYLSCCFRCYLWFVVVVVVVVVVSCCQDSDSFSQCSTSTGSRQTKLWLLLKLLSYSNMITWGPGWTVHCCWTKQVLSLQKFHYNTAQGKTTWGARFLWRNTILEVDYDYYDDYDYDYDHDYL